MMVPETTCGPIGWSRNSNSVPIPKLPPPPRTPQKRSAFSSSLAFTNWPSAVTRSTESSASIVSPNFRMKLADPPAQREPGQTRVRDEASRDGKPESLGFPIQVAEERAGLGADGPASGSTRMPRSMTIPSSHTDSPG